MAKRIKLIETAPVLMQAPDAPTSGDSEPVKRKTANHELLNAAGEVVETEEEATGIRYTLVENNQSFDYQSGMEPGSAATMLTVFGAKTLCTNESSAIRNNPKGAGSADEQIDAVRERFALLTTGKWVDRTREGVGAKVDKDVFANAICNVLVAAGVYTAEQVQSEKMAEQRQRLEDPAYLKKARARPDFAAEYGKLRGNAPASIDDFK